MLLRELFEEPGKSAVLAFGRLNPPTIGHAKLVETIKSIKGDHFLFLSQSQKPKTDPLDFNTKVKFAQAFFPGINIGNPEVNTPVAALQYLQDKGYTDIIFVAGSDRVEGFQKLFNTYNGQPDKSGNVPFKFNSIKVVSAGERDPDADGAEGMSASKMRAAAASGNLEAFAQGVPNQKLAQAMYDAVRKGMGITTEAVAVEPHAQGYQKDKLTMPANTLVIDTPGDLDWYKLGQDIANLDQADPHEYGQGDSDVVITSASPEEMQKLMKQLDRLGLKYKPIGGTHDQPEIHATENFLGKIKGALGLGWSKIGDTVRGSMILNYLDSQNFDASQNLKKRIKSSKFKLIEIDLETAKKYRAYTDKKVAFGGSMIDPDKEMHSRQWKLTHDSLIKSPPVLMSDGDILDGNHRLDRAIKLELPKIPVLMQVGKSVEENFADGKKPGRKGLAKRSGVNTKASVSSLRKTAKGSSGEKQRMAHWLANMKAGRAKAKK